MRKVFLAQLLCPQRHCVIAMAFEESTWLDKKQVEEILSAAMEGNRLNPLCGICGSPRLRVEIAPTVFRSLKEGLPLLKELEKQNAVTREAVREDAKG